MLKQFFRRLDFKPWHIATTRFRDKETGLMVTVQKDYRYRIDNGRGEYTFFDYESFSNFCKRHNYKL